MKAPTSTISSIAVVSGGTSNEHSVSLQTGEALRYALQDRYTVHNIYITSDGLFVYNENYVHPERAFRYSDVVINGLHGVYGEDGTFQTLLDQLGISYTGSKAFASALAMNKERTRTHLLHTVHQPVWRLLRKDECECIDECAHELYETFPQPSIIKPNTGGSSVGVVKVHSRSDIATGLQHAFQYTDSLIIEECIHGKEVSCSVIDQFRGERWYTPPVIEIIPDSYHDFFDYNAKYNGASYELCPGGISTEERTLIQNTARHVHKELGLRQYSRSDFIIHPRRGVYFLEVNTLPGMTDQSLFPQMLNAVGVSLSEFLDHIILHS